MREFYEILALLYSRLQKTILAIPLKMNLKMVVPVLRNIANCSPMTNFSISRVLSFGKRFYLTGLINEYDQFYFE